MLHLALLLLLLSDANKSLVWGFSPFHFACLGFQTHPSTNHRPTSSNDVADFDFSLAWAWEQYYANIKNNHDASSSVVVEWHGSVALMEIAQLVQQELLTSRHDSDGLVESVEPPLTVNESRESVTTTTSAAAKTCLLVGCGVSELLTALRAAMPYLSLILVDSSKTCIQHLTQHYGHDDMVQCACEDATVLALIDDDSVDVIVDKGFLDALLCSEGWNGPVERVLSAALRVLKTTGKYIWIGYPLPQSTLTFVAEAAPTLQ
jgi:hypothetical protein